MVAQRRFIAQRYLRRAAGHHPHEPWTRLDRRARLAELFHGLFSRSPGRLPAILSHGVAVAVAFALITFCTSSSVSSQPQILPYSIRTLSVARAPLILFTVATNPFIWLLNSSANALLRLLGASAASAREQRVHSPKKNPHAGGAERGDRARSTADDARLIEGVRVREKNAWDVMTPAPRWSR